jgi:hypothetical protein
MLKGVNIHAYPYGHTEANYVWNVFPRVIDIAWSMGIRLLRLGGTKDTVDTSVPSQLARSAMQVGLCRDRGIKTQFVFQATWRWNRTDGGAYADNATGRFNMGYNALKATLQALPVKPDYIEFENEMTLWSGVAVPYNQGLIPSFYETTAFLEYLDVLKGEYAAAREFSPGSKIIVGTVQGNYGFIPWLISKGVDMDVAGYHAYMRPIDDFNNWFGLGQKLKDVFTSWGKPVTINELNGNVSLGQPVMGQQAVIAFNEFSTWPMVESILAYELFDSLIEPGFGLCTLNAGNYTVNASQAAFAALLKA